MNWKIKIHWGSLLLLLLCFVTLQVNCTGESDKLAKKKLQVILKDDLDAILDGVADSALLNEPYYDLVFYKLFDEGNYSKKAIADFYFLKGVRVKIVRKYRYYRTKRMWERYFNEYSSFSDSAVSSPKE